MDAQLIRRVWQRARSRCEYCRLPANVYPAPFQIDHIIARQHGGTAEDGNLALACIHCNRYKGPNIAGLDPQTRRITRLFNPREDSWEENFEWEGAELRALTDVGRATIAVLFMNDPELLVLRHALLEER